MALKTLKELIKKNDDELSFGGYTEDILRQEAIKWVKELNDGRPSELDYDVFIFSEPGTPHQDHDAIAKWVKHFFNITEEELK